MLDIDEVLEFVHGKEIAVKAAETAAAVVVVVEYETAAVEEDGENILN